jgi:hypothetical protein
MTTDPHSSRFLRELDKQQAMARLTPDHQGKSMTDGAVVLRKTTD